MAGEIEWKLRSYLAAHPSGIVRRNVAFSFPEILDADREGVVPGLCYIPNGQLDREERTASVQQGVIPALVVEILSLSTEKIDLVDKVEIYRAAGLREYWIFDWRAESVRIHRFEEDPEKPVAVKSFDDTLQTPLLPEFSLELPRIRQALAIGRKGSTRSQ